MAWRVASLCLLTGLVVSCSNAAEASPCDLLTHRDAQVLLGVEVSRMRFAAFDDLSDRDATDLDGRSCIWQPEDEVQEMEPSARAALWVDLTEAERDEEGIRHGFEDGDEVNGIGEFAWVQESDGGFEVWVVMTGDRSFFIEVIGDVGRDRVISLARTVARRRS